MTLFIPINFNQMSLLLAVTSIILLITSNLIDPILGRTNLTINKKRFQHVAIITSLLFLITVAIKMYELILSI